MPITVYEAYNEQEEAEYAVNEILKLVAQKTCKLRDCAVMYRTNAQSRIFEEALRKKNIPYRIYGGVSFYQRKEIKRTLRASFFC